MAEVKDNPCIPPQPNASLSRSYTVGAESWRNNTLRNIRLAQTLARKAENNVSIGRSIDPLPNLHDVTIQITNNNVHKYNRYVRAVLAKIRAELIEVNKEIKLLYKIKENLDKWHEYIRKDLRVNEESSLIRDRRPRGEREYDGVNDLLIAEKSHLKNLKENLECQLKLVLQHLKEMDRTRLRLFNVQQERTSLLDLVCHTISAEHQSNCLSAVERKKVYHGEKRHCDILKNIKIDPLGALTPEIDSALAEGKDVRARSKHLREESDDLLKRTLHLRREAHKSVNSGVQQKVAETTNLRQHLTLGIGENRHAIQKSQRWFDESEISYLRTLGPESSKYMTTREQLNRPIVRIYQRHPGNQVPEGKNLVEHGDKFLNSMKTTSYNIGLLKLSKERQHNDQRSKTLASQLDSDVLRLRRRKENHRWAMGLAF